MKKYDTIFLDRDGTLNPDPGYINSLDDYSFFDFTFDALRQLEKVGDHFCIITNQSGVGRGIIDIDELSRINSYILDKFYENKLSLFGIYYCTDHPDNATEYRKPGVGMFIKAAKDNGINLKRSIMIGDATSDIQCGLNLGMDTMLVLTGKGKETQSKLNEIAPTYCAQNILEGAKIIISGNN
mgnify:CR=1 FL=1|tara:strand:+ start:1023 stop:1571 length:549 start_codon:yes stop_codon:yes gene_type:complete